MTDSPESLRPTYPSRRSLRERSTTQAPPTAPPTLPRSQSPTGAEFVQAPRRTHVPDDTPRHTAPAVDRPPFRRRVAQGAAAASVAGLVLTLALPLTQQSTTDEVAASAQQRLFSEVSSDEIPASFTEISAVATDDESPASYTFQPDMVVNYPFNQPVLLTDVFGYRTAPVAQFHDAQDFAADAGTPIQSIADGTVLEAGFAPDGCGFGLKLEHLIDGHEVTSRYCHMQSDSHSYEVGDSIVMGDPVGKVGATGMSFGAHLHLALVVDGEPIDPMPFLAKYSRMHSDEVSPSDNGDAPTGDETPDLNGEAIATSDEAATN